jgi:hypothetical protein
MLVSWPGRNLPMRISLNCDDTAFTQTAAFSVATDFCHPQVQKWLRDCGASVTSWCLPWGIRNRLNSPAVQRSTVAFPNESNLISRFSAPFLAGV